MGRGSARSQIYACARNADDKKVEAWLETIESYTFTAKSGVLALERILASDLVGATTPALAFGADFVLELEGSTRFETFEFGPRGEKHSADAALAPAVHL